VPTILVATQSFQDWRRLLARPDRHWKAGFSAMSLAKSWQAAAGLPPEVRAMFDSTEFGASPRSGELVRARQCSETQLFLGWCKGDQQFRSGNVA